MDNGVTPFHCDTLLIERMQGENLDIFGDQNYEHPTPCANPNTDAEDAYYVPYSVPRNRPRWSFHDATSYDGFYHDALSDGELSTDEERMCYKGPGMDADLYRSMSPLDFNDLDGEHLRREGQQLRTEDQSFEYPTFSGRPAYNSDSERASSATVENSGISSSFLKVRRRPHWFFKDDQDDQAPVLDFDQGRPAIDYRHGQRPLTLSRRPTLPVSIRRSWMETRTDQSLLVAEVDDRRLTLEHARCLLFLEGGKELDNIAAIRSFEMDTSTFNLSNVNTTLASTEFGQEDSEPDPAEYKWECSSFPHVDMLTSCQGCSSDDEDNERACLMALSVPFEEIPNWLF